MKSDSDYTCVHKQNLLNQSYEYCDIGLDLFDCDTCQMKQSKEAQYKITTTDMSEQMSKDEEKQKIWDEGFNAGKQENEHLVWQISEANFEKGKEVGKKETIDKACEWLRENSGYYVEHCDGDTWINSELYEDFRKAMEE